LIYFFRTKSTSGTTPVTLVEARVTGVVPEVDLVRKK
jgi:hypothetical protein